MVNERLSPKDFQFLGTELGGQFSREKVRVRQAKNLGGVLFAEMPGESGVGDQETAVQILDVKDFGQQINQRAKQLAFVDNALFRTFAFRGFPLQASQLTAQRGVKQQGGDGYKRPTLVDFQFIKDFRIGNKGHQRPVGKQYPSPPHQPVNQAGAQGHVGKFTFHPEPDYGTWPCAVESHQTDFAVLKLIMVRSVGCPLAPVFPRVVRAARLLPFFRSPQWVIVRWNLLTHVLRMA